MKLWAILVLAVLIIRQSFFFLYFSNPHRKVLLIDELETFRLKMNQVSILVYGGAFYVRRTFFFTLLFITKWIEGSAADKTDFGEGCLSGLDMEKRKDSPCNQSTFRCPKKITFICLKRYKNTILFSFKFGLLRL